MTNHHNDIMKEMNILLPLKRNVLAKKVVHTDQGDKGGTVFQRRAIASAFLEGVELDRTPKHGFLHFWRSKTTSRVATE